MALTEGTHYYNNTFETEGELVGVDRIYLFDDDEFTFTDWVALAHIYSLLPEHINDGKEGVPYWFGIEGVDPLFLYMSVEPGGFQLCGKLAAGDFAEWEARFHELTERFPFRREA